MTRLRSETALALRRKLAMQRPMMSLIERDMLAASPDIRWQRDNWIAAFVDLGHGVSFDRGRTTAFRAISADDGGLFWLVRHEDKAHGYHSRRQDPLAAVEEAHGAWAARRQVRRNWSSVEALARDLMLGRRKLRVRIEDAYASPLCDMGVAAFLRRLHISWVREVSGRTAAILMKIDPQVGFVIHQAEKRHARAAGLPEATVRGAEIAAR